jgi:hypothetical protein
MCGLDQLQVDFWDVRDERRLKYLLYEGDLSLSYSLASLHLPSRCTGLKHPKPTVLGPAIIIVVIAALFIIDLIKIISLNSPCLF